MLPNNHEILPQIVKKGFLNTLGHQLLSCSFPGGPVPSNGPEIFFQLYKEKDFLVMLDVGQLACNPP